MGRLMLVVLVVLSVAVPASAGISLEVDVETQVIALLGLFVVGPLLLRAWLKHGRKDDGDEEERGDDAGE